MRYDVLPQVRRLVILHETEVLVSLVDDEEVRHDGDDVGQAQVRHLDVQHELQAVTSHSYVLAR